MKPPIEELRCRALQLAVQSLQGRSASPSMSLIKARANEFLQWIQIGY